MLERDGDGTINFGVRILTGTGPTDSVSREKLKDSIVELFEDKNAETVLLYFAGHGYIESTGGYILPSDAKRGDDGVSLSEILTLANKSNARNRIILLDSCHSGIAGAKPTSQTAEISEGVSILTASTAEQYAEEVGSGGVFTTLLVDALSGAAANLLGEITPGSVYAHIDRSLGAWDQRPVFKTNVKSFVSLRKVQPAVTLAELHRLTEFFPSPGAEFKLDPSFEPERPLAPDPGVDPNPLNTAKFLILQKFNRVGLVIPVSAPHMYHAAIHSKSCKLTVFGEHYRRLVEQQRI
jgi:hypothetical protein